MKDDLELIRHGRDAEIKRREKRKLFIRTERKSYLWFFTVMGVMGVIFILKLCVLDIDKVSGLSMYPALDDKDLLLVEKYDTTNISRYDVVILRVKDESDKNINIVKRVYGLPGETVEIHSDGSVYINGVRLPDEHQILNNSSSNEDLVEYKTVLQIGQYYVLGDNRDVSLDSRYYGPFSRNDIKGVLIKKLF